MGNTPRNAIIGERDLLPALPVGEIRNPEWKELSKLAAVRPRSAVRSAWRLIAADLVQIARKHKLDLAPSAWVMPMVIGALLLNAGAISEAQYSLLSKLRRLVADAERAPVGVVRTEDAEDVVNLSLRLTTAPFVRSALWVFD